MTEATVSQVRWGGPCNYDCCFRDTPIHHTRTHTNTHTHSHSHAMFSVSEMICILKRNLSSDGTIVECRSYLSKSHMNVSALWSWVPRSLRVLIRDQPTVTKTSTNWIFKVVKMLLLPYLYSFNHHRCGPCQHHFLSTSSSLSNGTFLLEHGQIRSSKRLMLPGAVLS